MHDYIDFIDSPAVRDFLRTRPALPPAQQCILVAQSEIAPLRDKLAALRAIRDASGPEDFSRGCWKFQSDDPFPAILDRYIRTREERLERLEAKQSGVVYVVEAGPLECGAGTPFSSFRAALDSIAGDDENPFPRCIRRRRIDDTAGAVLVARLTAGMQVWDVDVERDGDEADMHERWAGDLPSGWAYVPHPFRRGDIVRQDGTFYVVTSGAETAPGVRPCGLDESDMQIPALWWNARRKAFCHEHVRLAHGGLDRAEPADLPEKARVLAAVSLLLRGRNSIDFFLEAFTNRGARWLGDNAVEILQNGSMADIPAIWKTITKSDVPGLPANVFVCQAKMPRVPLLMRVQRNTGEKPVFGDSEEFSLDGDPRFAGGAGDLSAEDVAAVRAFAVRNIDPLRAFRNGEISFDDLRAKLRGRASGEA